MSCSLYWFLWSQDFLCTICSRTDKKAGCWFIISKQDCVPPPQTKKNLLVYYVRCIDQFNFNSSIYDHMWCQQCRYRTSSVGCWWICHLMIHRYLRCSLLHSHVGGMGQLWMTPLGSVIFLPRLATSITSHLVLSALKGVCAQRDGSVDALSLCPE